MSEGAPTTINAVLEGEGDMAALARLIDKARMAGGERFFVPENAAEFGPCVTDPEKIICIGLNYRKHAAETGNPVPPVPILFNKFNSALNHHGGTIAVSKEPAEKFDYEAELVIVIGREARNVSEEDAPNYIFGYATGNDFTARDLQSRTSQWMIGKSGDGWAPLGPWLVTADQVDGDNLKIELKVNGETRAVLQHLGHGVRLQEARQLHLETHDAEARRHHLHRHAGGGDLGNAEGQAGLAQSRRQGHDLDREAGGAVLPAHLATSAGLRGIRIHTCRLLAPPSPRSAKPSGGEGQGWGVVGRGERATRMMRRLGQGAHRQPRLITDEAPWRSAPHPARPSAESALPATRFASGAREELRAGLSSPLYAPI